MCSRALPFALSLVLLAGAGCSGNGAAEFGAGGGGGRRTTTTVPKSFPLTGLDVADAAMAARPALTIKVENSPASRPQSGLDKADVVFEPLVEGGQTRFLAVFHSTDADPVGPVRSVRSSDPAIVAPFGGGVAYAGGIPRFVQAMEATGLQNFHEDNAGGAFQRRRDKRAPHNLYTSTSALYGRLDGGSPPPEFARFLDRGETFAPPGGVPVTQITLGIGRTTRIDYTWDPGSSSWLRSTDGRPHFAEGGGQLAPTTVIVQFVPYEDTGEVDVSGSPVVEAKVVGSGEAVVFANGTMVQARWSKPSPTAMTEWTDLSGAPLELPRGRTWVELPAPGAPLTTQ